MLFVSVVNQSIQVIRRFIEEAGITTQSLGIGRNVGQIYAYLYFSPEPRNLNDIQDALGISKGSTSMSVRQLEQWAAVHRVWIKGDRKDYWEASDWFGRILKRAIFDTVAQKMSVYAALIDEAEAELQYKDERSTFNDQPRTKHQEPAQAFLLERLRHMRRFHDKARKTWANPLLQRLLK